MSLRRFWGATALAFGVPMALVDAYLLGLLAAAAGGRRAPRDGPEPAAAAGRASAAVVLVPAHDEADGVGATIASLCAACAGAEVIVIADNCTDATADVAWRAGATVWERDEPQRRGKGHALAWALERLWRERPSAEVVVMVDADCAATPNLVPALVAVIDAGAGAAQARYEVANPEASPATGLRSAAWALWNTVRPLGKERLGLSAGLLGTGMAFRRDVLRRVPWEAFSVAEDAEYHARLVAAGERVAFVAEAAVTSAIPVALRETDQQLRWESGRTAVARVWGPRLVRDGLRRRDVRAVHAGLELAVPPQSLQVAGVVAGFVAARRTRGRLLGALAGGNIAAQVVYVLGGLAVAGVPRTTYRALAFAPLLVAQKLLLYTRIATVGGPQGWVRTRRDPSTPTEAR